MLWVNFMGLGLLAWQATRDYAVARVGGVLVLCLLFFFTEHFVGLGAHPPLLPFSTVLSIWLIWRHRAVLAAHWRVEALFAVGFLYCLVWRYAFPDIDLTAERIPDLAFIHDYMPGDRLPPADRWLSLYKLNFYYSFQYYGAALLGRWLRLEPGLSYHLAYCTIAGMITCAAGTAAARWCSWKPGRWLNIVALLMGGSGLALAVRVMIRKNPPAWEFFRFIGLERESEGWTSLGKWINDTMFPAGARVFELPVDMLNNLLMNGEYHPPLAGFVLLSFAVLLIASLETGAEGRTRAIQQALLAATVPLALISNTWIFPLQAILVGGWFIYRTVLGERTHWLPGLLGAALACGLEYPFLIEFTSQNTATAQSVRLTPADLHSPPLAWLLVFWPVVGIMALAFLNQERRALAIFLVLMWSAQMAFSEFLYCDDFNQGTWERFNSTLKWWPWIFTGIVMTLGTLNLGARSRICRYGTVVILLASCMNVYDVARAFVREPKDHMGHLNGSAWLTDSYAIRNFVTTLSARPDGVAIESGLSPVNSESSVLSLFCSKSSLLGWPLHESLWRGDMPDAAARLEQIEAFYVDKMPDPLTWLLLNNVRYVLWLQRDNIDGNIHFLSLREKIEPRYVWHGIYGNNHDWSIGFWERADFPALQPPD